MMRAIKLPASTIVTNAGGEGSVVIHNLLADHKTSQGYDASADKFVDMFQSGCAITPPDPNFNTQPKTRPLCPFSCETWAYFLQGLLTP